MKVTAEFAYIEDKKHAVRYDEIAFTEGRPYKFGALYIRKSTLGAERPAKLTVEVTW